MFNALLNCFSVRTGLYPNVKIVCWFALYVGTDSLSRVLTCRITSALYVLLCIRRSGYREPCDRFLETTVIGKLCVYNIIFRR